MDRRLLDDLLRANQEVFDEASQKVYAKPQARIEQAMIETAVSADGLGLPEAETFAEAERAASKRIADIRAIAHCEVRMLLFQKRMREKGIREFCNGHR